MFMRVQSNVSGDFVIELDSFAALNTASLGKIFLLTMLAR